MLPFFSLFVVFVLFYVLLVRTILDTCINMSGLKGAKSDRLRNEVFKEIKRLGMEPTYDPICTPELLNISFAKRQYTWTSYRCSLPRLQTTVAHFSSSCFPLSESHVTIITNLYDRAMLFWTKNSQMFTLFMCKYLYLISWNFHVSGCSFITWVTGWEARLLLAKALGG